MLVGLGRGGATGESVVRRRIVAVARTPSIGILGGDTLVDFFGRLIQVIVIVVGVVSTHVPAVQGAIRIRIIFTPVLSIVVSVVVVVSHILVIQLVVFILVLETTITVNVYVVPEHVAISGFFPGITRTRTRTVGVVPYTHHSIDNNIIYHDDASWFISDLAHVHVLLHPLVPLIKQQQQPKRNPDL